MGGVRGEMKKNEGVKERKEVMKIVLTICVLTEGITERNCLKFDFFTGLDSERLNGNKLNILGD